MKIEKAVLIQGIKNKTKEDETKNKDSNVYKFCPDCGFNNQPLFKFCPECGVSLLIN